MSAVGSSPPADRGVSTSPSRLGSPFRLGPWTVDPRSGEISRQREGETELRRLGPKVAAVLLRLAERPGEVVTKDELIAQVWNGAPFTSDEALAAVLYELRKALDDDARAPRYVETLRGSGYRLIARVEQMPIEAPADRAVRPSRPRRPWWTLAITGLPVLLAVAALVAVLLLLRSGPRRETPEPPMIRSLAVLPVTAYSPESRSPSDPLAAALTEMLTSDLSQICVQEVTPGIALRGRAEPETGGRWRLDQVVDLLGVDAVVEGSVLRSGNRLWISAQLVETSTGRMLWSDSWDRELGDELLVLREVALQAAREIRAALGSDALDTRPP